MSRRILAVSLLCLLALPSAALAADALQSPLRPAVHPASNYPKIVLYSVSWCPHCKEAKEYLTEHNIPFINKDVELDPQAMEELTNKYKSQGVPVIVLGDDRKVLKGFSRETFEQAVKELQKK